MVSRLAILLVLLVAACGGDSLAGLGDPCTRTDDCAEGLCIDGSGSGATTCVAECAGGDPCAAGTACGTLADGTRACLAACTDEGATIAGFGCVNRAQVACERAGGAVACSQCGCASDAFCPSTAAVDTCQPKPGEGESCLRNDDCATGSCSVHDASATVPGTCLKAAGAACTPGGDGCLSCDATAAGNVCAQSCGGADGCGGQECIGREDSGYFCRQGCYASRRCPAYWTCEVISDFDEVAYCAPPDRCDPTQTAPCGLFETCHPELRICY